MAAAFKAQPEQETASKAGTSPTHGVTVDIPGVKNSIHPPMLRHVSSPAYSSPLRHHHRKHSKPRQVKETLHARSEYTNSEDDGGAVHRINQYVIKQEIGRGSFGAVHLAVDQHGHEYAVKEFSKSRLRKRAQSHILRRPHAPRRAGHLAAGYGINSPLFRQSASELHDGEEGGNSLYLIKEEIAIMKKLNHQNLVSLIEVLDDPSEDSLYMVLEYCKKGVVMKVGVDDRADPYDEDDCRCWFRDLILGIEYLHAQGVVHRDIKPDNLLLTEDDVLKIVDFGVSEMFSKESEMKTAKSAGSPAFLPPELCVAKHGDVSGKAADIWSMGVTLYCLRYGRIPFEKTGVLELYESIRNDDVDLNADTGEDFRDLMRRILEKDSSKRIQMTELREHPWVTRGGTDPLLSAEENTANLIEPPTEEELNEAITSNLSNLLVVMKAAKRFKGLLATQRPEIIEDILGEHAHIVRPPLSMLSPDESPVPRRSRSMDSDDRRPIEKEFVTEGVHHDIDLKHFNISARPRSTSDQKDPQGERPATSEALNSEARHHHDSPSHATTHPNQTSTTSSTHGKGHAHNPLSDVLILAVGPGGNVGPENDQATGDGDDDAEPAPPPDPPIVSESPPAADIGIYECAYHDEVERIRRMYGEEATTYLTRQVERSRAENPPREGDDEDGEKSAGLGGGGGRLAKALQSVLAKETGKESCKEDTEKEE